LFPAQTTITDLLESGFPKTAAPAGHADPRTTGLYDQRKRKIRGISSKDLGVFTKF
jgi:hypothetical protein